MKKIIGWILVLVVIVFVSAVYYENITEDTIVDDVDLEDIVENEVASNGFNDTENKQETNHDDENIANNLNDDNTNKIESKLEVVAGSYTSLSNKTNAWGFVRKPEGTQPEFYGPYTKVLDDYEGIYAGNKEEKVIYLTFDEGYENGYTGVILDSLKQKNVVAVFFVTMPYVKANPDLIKRMIDEGHIIGNHTVNHPSMPEVTSDEKLIEEIMGLHNYMIENYNYEMTYLRPPKGEYSERTVKLSLDLGYKTVLWSSAYDDWNTDNQKGADYAKKMIYNNLHNGCVLLLHAVSKDNANVLPEVIDEIRSRGYIFESLDEFEN